MLEGSLQGDLVWLKMIMPPEIHFLPFINVSKSKLIQFEKHHINGYTVAIQIFCKPIAVPKELKS